MRRKSTETDSEMTQMMKLVKKDIKITITNTYHMFKELEEHMSVTRREVEDV